jgi:hypothetical protein
VAGRGDRGEVWDGVLPPGYGEEDARQDRRDLATLRAREVNWRVKRRLRHRVGGEDVLLERLAAWEAAAPPVPHPREAIAVVADDAAVLAARYREVCRTLYAADDPEVLANAAAIASGVVPPWEARRAIRAELDRASRRTGRSAVT